MLPGSPEPNLGDRLAKSTKHSGMPGTLARVNTRTAWLVYIVLRLLFFAVPLVVLLLLGTLPWLAVILAALIAVSLSVIFLSKSRDVASQSIYDWRNRDRTPDDIVEDEAVDAARRNDATGAPSAPEA